MVVYSKRMHHLLFISKWQKPADLKHFATIMDFFDAVSIGISYSIHKHGKILIIVK